MGVIRLNVGCYGHSGAKVPDIARKKKRIILSHTENDPHVDAKHTASAGMPAGVGDGMSCASDDLRLFVRQFDGAVLRFKVCDVLAQQVQNLSRYGAAVVFGDVLQLIVQFPVDVQTEMFIFFHVILTSNFE